MKSIATWKFTLPMLAIFLAKAALTISTKGTKAFFH